MMLSFGFIQYPLDGSYGNGHDGFAVTILRSIFRSLDARADTGTTVLLSTDIVRTSLFFMTEMMRSGEPTRMHAITMALTHRCHSFSVGGSTSGTIMIS